MFGGSVEKPYICIAKILNAVRMPLTYVGVFCTLT